jgi:replicative DNA helicase
MFIYRKASDRGYNREELSAEELNKAEIHIAKHRNGPTGKIDLFFDEEAVSFKSIERTGLQEN